MAFKLEAKGGKPVLAPVWISRDLSVSEPPVIANGVVIALSDGENARQQDASGQLMNSDRRAKTAPGKTVLYAFDSETGEELYSSGSTMASFSRLGGLSVSYGRVYVATYDRVVGPDALARHDFCYARTYRSSRSSAVIQ